MKIAVVIPSYKVKKHILGVIEGIGSEVDRIYVVDDKCPNQSGQFVLDNTTDKRVKVLFNPENKGVGGAVVHGYKVALDEGFDILVKLDGDGQMDARLIPALIKPIENQTADYSKGNRFFFHKELLDQMPKIRFFGNSALSFVNKIVSGYWDIMDPTNGFTAIHRTALSLIDLDKLENRYFFESDLLFRLGTIQAVVNDMPMRSKYEDEESNLSVKKVLFSFPAKYAKRFFKRIMFQYFVRDFNIGSVSLLVGSLLMLLGTVVGIKFWYNSIVYQELASSGTVMFSALPIILGFQFLLFSLNYDVQNVPRISLQKRTEGAFDS